MPSLLLRYHGNPQCHQWQQLSLQWRHIDRDSVTNLQPHDCLLNHLFRRRKHQSSASLAFVREIHRGPVNSPHKWPVIRKKSPFDDVIMVAQWKLSVSWHGRDNIEHKYLLTVLLPMKLYDHKQWRWLQCFCVLCWCHFWKLLLPKTRYICYSGPNVTGWCHIFLHVVLDKTKYGSNIDAPQVLVKYRGGQRPNLKQWAIKQMRKLRQNHIIEISEKICL